MDVIITFPDDPLPDDLSFAVGQEENAMRPLFSGALAEIEQSLSRMGITFDKGMGFGGRDWEWDWSLKGPVSVTFRGRTKPTGHRRTKPVRRDLKIVR